MFPKNYPQKLLVEGNDDLHVIYSLCKKFDLPENFNIIDCKGYSNLFMRIEAELLQAGLNTLGIIVDADTDLKSKWDSITGKLAKQGYIIPDNPHTGGSIIRAEGKPTVGIWIMPNNNQTGAIEEFVKFLIPPDDELLVEVDNVLNKIKGTNKQRFRDIDFQKGFISTWLAWQEKPGIPMGQAITFKFLNTDNIKELDLFIAWLKDVFQQ